LPLFPRGADFFFSDNLQTHGKQHDVQERELTLIRGYEAQLLERETADSERMLKASTDASNTIARLSSLLRSALRAVGGEDASLAGVPMPEDGDEDENEGWAAAAVAEWALEREAELARLECENVQLRRLLADQVALESMLAAAQQPPQQPQPPQVAKATEPSAQAPADPATTPADEGGDAAAGPPQPPPAGSAEVQEGD
jgi:hypothetical protein